VAFIVEDGTGVANATSYATWAQFTTYWADRVAASADPGPASSESDTELWLVAATDYISRVFNPVFKGRPANDRPDDQGLWFPVTGLYDERGNHLIDEVPEVLVHATIEYAFRAGSASLLADPSITTGQTISSAAVGSLSVTFASGGATTILTPYPLADRLLRELVIPQGGTIH